MHGWRGLVRNPKVGISLRAQFGDIETADLIFAIRAQRDENVRNPEPDPRESGHEEKAGHYPDDLRAELRWIADRSPEKLAKNSSHTHVCPAAIWAGPGQFVVFRDHGGSVGTGVVKDLHHAILEELVDPVPSLAIAAVRKDADTQSAPCSADPVNGDRPDRIVYS